MFKTLRAGGMSHTAAQVHHLNSPKAHPEWLLFQWSLRALGIAAGLIETLWLELLRGVKLQEEINEGVRARRASPGAPRPSVKNPFFERVAQGLGPLLRIEPGHGPMALWSGPYDISAFAQRRGYVTLEATAGGRALSRLELYRDAKAVAPLRKHLSLEFIRQNPDGEVHVFVRAHGSDRPLCGRALPTVDKAAPRRATTWHSVSGDQLESVRALNP